MPPQGRMLSCGVWIRFLPGWNPGVLAPLTSIVWSCPAVAPLCTPSPTVPTLTLTSPFRSSHFYNSIYRSGGWSSARLLRLSRVTGRHMGSWVATHVDLRPLHFSPCQSASPSPVSLSAREGQAVRKCNCVCLAIAALKPRWLKLN